jgi:hypothetical protein
MTEPGVEQEIAMGTIGAGTRGQIVVGGAGTSGGFFTARTGRKTRPRARDRNRNTRADICARGRDIWQLEENSNLFYQTVGEGILPVLPNFEDSNLFYQTAGDALV